MVTHGPVYRVASRGDSPAPREPPSNTPLSLPWPLADRKLELEHSFSTLLETLRPELNSALERTLAVQYERGQSLHPRVGECIRYVARLCQGGKRLRPGLCYAGFHAATTHEAPADLLKVGCALELLQAYFLIHDDWMDRDVLRRGMPSAHIHLAEVYQDAHLGAAAAILAGDFANALAQELLAEVRPPKERQAELHAAFAEMQTDAVLGQKLDITGNCDPAQLTDPEQTYRLKTASYTVRGPLLLGAIFADAPRELLDALRRYSIPSGIAFQLRDDLLGMFGDPNETGKKVGGDLQAGKHTSLYLAGLRLSSAAERSRLERAYGNPQASPAELEEAVKILHGSGAQAEVEARIQALTKEALAALEAPSLLPQGKQLLHSATLALTERQV